MADRNWAVSKVFWGLRSWEDDYGRESEGKASDIITLRLVGLDNFSSDTFLGRLSSLSHKIIASCVISEGSILHAEFVFILVPRSKSDVTFVSISFHLVGFFFSVYLSFCHIVI